MARVVPELLDKDIQHLAHERRLGKLNKTGSVKRADGYIPGLMVESLPDGSIWWRYKYFGPTAKNPSGAWTMRSLGKYPDVSIRAARDLAQDIASSVRRGVSVDHVLMPSKRELEEKIKREIEEQGVSFKLVYDKWIVDRERIAKKKTEQNRATMGEWTLHTNIKRLNRYVLPKWGDKPIKTITKEDALALLEGAYSNTQDGAHRIYLKLHHIFEYAVSEGYLTNNIFRGWKMSEEVGSVKEGHQNAITDPQEFKVLLQAIDEWTGGPVVKIALNISSHVFLRSKELRNSTWNEVDFEKREWIIPAKRMKIHKNGDHWIPLSDEMIELLTELKKYQRDSDLMFPDNKGRCLSESSLINAIHRMGFDNHTQHGFRATFHTIGSERLNFDLRHVELQLHHSLGTPMGKAYGRAEYKEERRKMMEAWSRYLTELKGETK